MRQYLLVANGEERKIREERVKSSNADAEKDSIAQKTVIRLELAPFVSSNDFNKERGIVFGYESTSSPAISSSAKLVSNLPSVAVKIGVKNPSLEQTAGIWDWFLILMTLLHPGFVQRKMYLVSLKLVHPGQNRGIAKFEKDPILAKGH